MLFALGFRLNVEELFLRAVLGVVSRPLTGMALEELPVSLSVGIRKGFLWGIVSMLLLLLLVGGVCIRKSLL